MGMYDTLYVRKSNKVGIPVQEGVPHHHRGYQTKSLGCTLAVIEIDENGRLFVEHDGRGSAGVNVGVKAIKSGKYSATDLVICGNNAEGKWEEYNLVVVDNQIVRVHLYEKLIYLAEGYPMLDETINPVPKDHYLDVEITTGVYPNPGRRSHRFFHNAYKIVDLPDHITEGAVQHRLSAKHHQPTPCDGEPESHDQFESVIDKLHSAAPGLVDPVTGSINLIYAASQGKRLADRMKADPGGYQSLPAHYKTKPINLPDVDMNPNLKARVEEIIERAPKPTLSDIWDFHQQAFKTGQKVHVDCQVDPKDPLKMNVTLFTDGTPAGPIRILGVDPGKNPLFNLNEFQNGVIMGLKNIVDNPFKGVGTSDTNRLLEPLNKNVIGKTSLWLEQLCQINHRPEIVFDRRLGIFGWQRYSKGIQTIVVKRRTGNV